MKLFALLLTLFLSVPPADAAVIATTKQKKLPTIANLRVDAGYAGFGFDVVKAPTTNAYDVWGRLTDERGRTVHEWFARSMKFRRRHQKAPSVTFRMNLADVLAYEGDGRYGFTIFACPANVKRPTDRACATAVTTVDYAARDAE